jgi:hypothetical protein
MPRAPTLGFGDGIMGLRCQGMKAPDRTARRILVWLGAVVGYTALAVHAIRVPVE